MGHSAIFILCIIFTAYLFEFINGFHDAANSIATIVTTGVLTPRQAVIWAAFFNFIAFMFCNLMVAKIIGNGLIDPRVIDPELILAALIGAIVWNLITWFFGLPSSSSHALIGGLSGVALTKSGFASLNLFGFIKVGIGIFISPLVGLLIGFILTYGFTRLTRNTSKKSRKKLFSSLQIVSSAFLSLTHGGNDAQKTMGIIAVLLFSASWLKGEFYIPMWIVISCHTVISLGTLLGGWKIVRTMGTKITHLDPLRGCSAETGSAIMIGIATEYGVPVSTTQTVTGAIVGVGLVSGLSGAHWPIVKIIFLSWLFTIPAAGLIAAGIFKLLNFSH